MYSNVENREIYGQIKFDIKINIVKKLHTAILVKVEKQFERISFLRLF